MKILAIETSSALGSVALSVDGRISGRVIDSVRDQAARLLPSIDALLAAAEIEATGLDLVAFGHAPGSFTGLRIASATSQGLAMATGVPVAGISSLATLACRAARETGRTAVSVCINARMGEVYTAQFRITESGLPQVVQPPALQSPAEMVAAFPPQTWVAAGDGWALDAARLSELKAEAAAVDSESLPLAEDMLPAAEAALRRKAFLPLDQIVPIYLRGSEAWTKQ